MRYAQGLYFRLKDEVFCGKRPYSSEPLERFMRKEFGDNTRMSEIQGPKLVYAHDFPIQAIQSFHEHTLLC